MGTHCWKGRLAGEGRCGYLKKQYKAERGREWVGEEREEREPCRRTNTLSSSRSATERDLTMKRGRGRRRQGPSTPRPSTPKRPSESRASCTPRSGTRRRSR